MTVGELKALLRMYPDGAPVVIVDKSDEDFEIVDTTGSTHESPFVGLHIDTTGYDL
jgi:hypothetical protein